MRWVSLRLTQPTKLRDRYFPLAIADKKFYLRLIRRTFWRLLGDKG
jgi:hypothetical protein